MQDKICVNCKRFIQHYVKIGKSYVEANCGHCVFPRIKKRSPDTPACMNYTEKRGKKRSYQNGSSLIFNVF